MNLEELYTKLDKFRTSPYGSVIRRAMYDACLMLYEALSNIEKQIDFSKDKLRSLDFLILDSSTNITEAQNIKAEMEIWVNGHTNMFETKTYDDGRVVHYIRL